MTRRPPRTLRSRAALHRRRLLVLAGLGLTGYGLMLGRAFQLQAVDAEWLARRAARQHESTLQLGPLRGDVRDRRGLLLASSAQVASVTASPRRIEDLLATTRKLARALGLSNREVKARLDPNRSFAWIKRWVTPEEAERVDALAIPGINLHPERKRFYPSRELAASYLGFAGRDGEGLSGVELAFDGALRGSQAKIRAVRDARGNKLLDVAAERRGRAGATLVLALDARLQLFAEQALARAIERTGARSATLVALDPRHGDVLAIAQVPGFDPNQFWKADPAAYRTRALLDPFEPGSTFKPFAIAVALERGAVEPDDRFDCENGTWRVSDRRIHDWKPYGVLSVHDIVRLSSNIGAAKVAERVGSRNLVEGLRGFGFGERTGSDFPGEARGILHDLDETQVVERANLAFGQGVSVTALQLATAGAVLANGGLSVQPRIALRLEDHGKVEPFPEVRGERVISERTANTVLAMMRDVVASGTGRNAALPRHAVAGKTGTAQKVVNGRYSDQLFVASFLGILPADAPRLVIVVVLDEPRRGSHTGGAAAAPVFREVANFAVEQLGITRGGEV